jgi:signal-transduction protein with cAMP-binding, CBS, and nucleotidyltransferase domain
MLKNHISGLPVVDEKAKLIGIVSEGDFLRRPEMGTERERSPRFDAFFGPSESAKDYVRSHGMKVQEIMTPKPVTVGEHTPLDEVVHLMETHGVKRLPVLRRGKIVGIVSRANLMRALASLHRVVLKSSKSDAAIRNRILADIDKQSWSAGAFVDVAVHDGLIDLWGSINDVAQRKALKVLAEGVPGVRRVHEHLTWNIRKL